MTGAHGGDASGRRVLGWILGLFAGFVIGGVSWMVVDHVALRGEVQSHIGRANELFEVIKRLDAGSRSMDIRLDRLERVEKRVR